MSSISGAHPSSPLHDPSGSSPNYSATFSLSNLFEFPLTIAKNLQNAIVTLNGGDLLTPLQPAAINLCNQLANMFTQLPSFLETLFDTDPIDSSRLNQAINMNYFSQQCSSLSSALSQLQNGGSYETLMDFQKTLVGCLTSMQTSGTPSSFFNTDPDTFFTPSNFPAISLDLPDCINNILEANNNPNGQPFSTFIETSLIYGLLDSDPMKSANIGSSQYSAFTTQLNADLNNCLTYTNGMDDNSINNAWSYLQKTVDPYPS
jgi:hypothetical protein